MTQSRPPLVIVSGAPGSGKTTLAGILADRLELPLIARDELKERLADVLLPADDGRHEGDGGIDSKALGRASYAMLFAVTDRLLQAGTGAIIESYFRRGLAEPELAPHVARAAGVLVHCQPQMSQIVGRVRARADSANRHRVHGDVERLDDLECELTDGSFEPLQLDLETTRVETSAGYAPPLDELVARVRAAIRSP